MDRANEPRLPRTSPSGTWSENRSYNAEWSQEHENLLACSRVGGRPLLSLPANKKNGCSTVDIQIDALERDWEVIKTLSGRVCLSPHYVLELVHLKCVNFGLRWRDVRETVTVPPRCVMGPHWVLMVATWFTLGLLATLVNVLTFEKAGSIQVAAGVLLSGMCLTCYALVACTNPGIVTRRDVPLDDTFTYCDRCDSYRPEGALHCMDCRVCIEEYDHHCPWTGKCVGKRNVRYFYAWLVFLVLAFVYEAIQFTTYLMPADGADPLDSLDESLDLIVSPALHK